MSAASRDGWSTEVPLNPARLAATGAPELQHQREGSQPLPMAVQHRLSPVLSALASQPWNKWGFDRCGEVINGKGTLLWCRQILENRVYQRCCVLWWFVGKQRGMRSEGCAALLGQTSCTRAAVNQPSFQIHLGDAGQCLSSEMGLRLSVGNSG